MTAPRSSPGTEHAPTPWQIGIALYPYVHFYGPSDKAGGALAVGACVTALGKEYDEANAAFIVKAVNEHAEVEKALQELCGRHGFAAGHGDTLADIIREIDGQIPVPGSAQTVPPDTASDVDLADELMGLHNACTMDGQGGDGQFRVVCSSGSTEQALALRAVLRQASAALRRKASEPAAWQALVDVARYLESATPNLKSARLCIRAALSPIPSTSHREVE